MDDFFLYGRRHDVPQMQQWLACKEIPNVHWQLWRSPEDRVRIDSVEASAELNSWQTKNFEHDGITRLCFTHTLWHCGFAS